MSIFERVISFIENPEPAALEPLALGVFRHQFQSIAPYREYCRALGVSPNSVRSLGEIPLVSTIAFKYAHLGPADAERVFVTSGTSVGEDSRGRHPIARLEVYRRSALAHLARMVFPDGMKLRMLALHPTIEWMPQSSLAQMISWCIEAFGAGQSLCAARPAGIDADAAIDFLRRAERERAPVCILGTTAACSTIFARIRISRAPISLANGSRLMDTGGAKGHAVPLAPREIVELADAQLGIAPAMTINEYGMTEMCSQLYDATPLNSEYADAKGDRVKLPPPWLRARAVDPITLQPLWDGQAGLLAYFDLANVGSVSALLTEDLGVVERGAVRIMGRAEGSEDRGCALGIARFAAVATALS